LVEERQKRIDAAFVHELLTQLGELPVEVDLVAAREAFDRVLPRARRHELSVYDATYLELAVREQVPLATFDDALGVAAKREGTRLFGGAMDER
jgi:predicted nucleic acid-binding protein